MCHAASHQSCRCKVCSNFTRAYTNYFCLPSFKVDTMMRPADSPDTIPSLTESSLAESPQDHVSRKLFQSEDKESIWEEMVKVSKISEKNAFHDEECSVFDAPRSVVSLDLAVESPLARGVDIDEKIALKRSIRSQSEHFLKCTESAEDATSVFGSVPPRKPLVNLFSMFDSNQRPQIWPSTKPMCGSTRTCFEECGQSNNSEDDITFKLDNTTSVTTATGPHWLEEKWRKKAIFVERECVALKELVQIDAERISRLKEALKGLNENEKQRKLEMATVTLELKKARKYIEVLSKEHEEFAEREAQHLETIKHLKKEINELTENRNVPYDEKMIESLKFENDLFAAQMVENERLMDRFHVQLGCKDAENERLQLTIESLQERLESDGEASLVDARSGKLSNYPKIPPISFASRSVTNTPRTPVHSVTMEGSAQDSLCTAGFKSINLDDSTCEPDISPQPRPAQLEIANLSACLQEKQAEINNLRAQVLYAQQRIDAQHKDVDECGPFRVISEWCN